MIALCRHPFFASIGGWGALLAVWSGAVGTGAASTAAEPVPPAVWQLPGSPLVQRYPVERTGLAGRPRVLSQLPDQRMAVGTDRGLFLFDGQRWETVAGHSGVSSIVSLADGRVYLGSGSEVHELRPNGRGGFDSRPAAEGLLRDRPDSVVFSLSALDGVVYALDGTRLLIVPTDGSPPSRIELPTWCEGGFVLNRQYYVRTAEPYEPLRRFDRSTGSLIAAQELLPSNWEERVVAHSLDRSGKVWFAGESGRFFVSNGREVRLLPDHLGPSGRLSQIHAMQALPRGGVAVATIDRGLILLDGDGRPWARPAGLESSGVSGRLYALGLDRNDGLWLGAGLELTRIDARFETTLYGERDGLVGEVWAMERFQDRLYVATDAGLFREASPASPLDVAFEQVPGIPPTRSLARTTGGLWVAAQHVRLLTDDGVWRDFGPQTWGPNPIVPWRGGRDHVVAGVRDGLRIFRRTAGEWQDVGPVPGVHRQVFNLAQTASGDLWISYGTGLLARVRSSAGKWRVQEFGAAEGIPNRWVHLGTREEDVFVGTDEGTLWWNEAAGRFEPSAKLIYYGSSEPLGFDPVFSDDAATWVWPQTTVGTLVRRPRPEVLAAISIATGHVRTRSRTVLRETDGTVWVGLPAGLLRDAPATNLGTLKSPRVQLRRLVDLRTGQAILGPVLSDQEIALEARQNSIRVEAALPEFGAENFQHFRLQLRGFEQEPPFAAHATREFTHLPAGRYELLISAIDGGGRLAVPLEVALTVRAPLYATVWAYVGYVLLAGLMVLALVRWRVTQIRRHAEKLQTAVNDRTSELSRQTTLLADEKKLFASLAAAAPVGIWHGDREGRVVFVNPAFEAICGRAADELLRDGWWPFVHPEDRSRAVGLVHEAVAEGKVTSGELRLLRPDGDIRWVLVGAAPVSPAAGGGAGLVGTALDVTERRDVERRMMRAQRLESIGTLTGGIAHDLNNALVPIIAGASLLENEPDQERRALLADIERSAKRAAGMVRQLLAFARGMDGQRVPVDLVPILLELGRILGRTLPKNITIEHKYRERSAYVQGDPTQLHQVLLNLCVNARDAMPEGGQLTVRLETCRVIRAQDAFHEPIPRGEYRLITVEDTGTGIEPSVLEHIFDPFFTTKEPDRGTGLGLSTTLGIIRGHQGHISVDTKQNAGTRFAVYLPAIAPPAELSSSPPVGPAERVTATMPTTALVVDDEVTVRSVVMRSLQRLNLRCLEAGDGAQGLRVWEERKDDIGLLIVDLSMPVMDGITFLKSIRQHAPSVPVIAFSGNITEDHRRELRNLAVRQIVPKPFRYDDLVAAVRAALS